MIRTRTRILTLLDLVVLEMGNGLPLPTELAQEVTARDELAAVEAEWAYVKGIAAGAVLQLRDRLQGVQ